MKLRRFMTMARRSRDCNSDEVPELKKISLTSFPKPTIIPTSDDGIQTAGESRKTIRRMKQQRSLRTLFLLSSKHASDLKSSNRSVVGSRRKFSLSGETNSQVSTEDNQERDIRVDHEDSGYELQENLSPHASNDARHISTNKSLQSNSVATRKCTNTKKGKPAYANIGLTLSSSDDETTVANLSRSGQALFPDFDALSTAVMSEIEAQVNGRSGASTAGESDIGKSNGMKPGLLSAQMMLAKNIATLYFVDKENDLKNLPRLLTSGEQGQDEVEVDLEVFEQKKQGERDGTFSKYFGAVEGNGEKVTALAARGDDPADFLKKLFFCLSEQAEQAFFGTGSQQASKSTSQLMDTSSNGLDSASLALLRAFITEESMKKAMYGFREMSAQLLEVSARIDAALALKIEPTSDAEALEEDSMVAELRSANERAQEKKDGVNKTSAEVAAE